MIDTAKRKEPTMNTYQELKKLIQHDIENGTLRPGDRLPSERQLSALHGLSRMTVRRALTELAAAGALYKHQGRGTFVSARKMQQRNIASFSQTVRQKGYIPSTKVIAFAAGKPGKDIADRLMLQDTDVYRAMRIRSADATPIAVEEVFIPFPVCPGLSRGDLETSLYQLIGEAYGHKIGSVDSTVSALHPSAQQQAHLGISRHTPVLKVDSLYFSASGAVLYYERAVYRSDMYEYTIRIST